MTTLFLMMVPKLFEEYTLRFYGSFFIYSCSWLHKPKVGEVVVDEKHGSEKYCCTHLKLKYKQEGEEH
jgi:hypothetical protein